MPSKRIAVFMGGISPEREISVQSGAVAARHLFEAGHDVCPVVIEKTGSFVVGRKIASIGDCERLVADVGIPDRSPLFQARATALDATSLLSREGTDVAFLALHGTGGEDGTIQGLLDWADIPYTGSGVRASVVAIDKCVFKAVIAAAGVSTAPFVVIETSAWQSDHRAESARVRAEVGSPCVVKAGDLGSSFGVEVVRKDADLEASIDAAAKLSERVLVEKFIAGREFTCPVFGDARFDRPRALPVIEIVPKKGEFFDYESKYSTGGADEICPAQIGDDLARAIQETAVRVHTLTGCSGVSRTDMIWDGKALTVLEINTIPGMTAASLLPKSAAAYGWSLAKLFSEMAEFAFETARRRKAALEHARTEGR